MVEDVLALIAIATLWSTSTGEVSHKCAYLARDSGRSVEKGEKEREENT